MIACMCMYVWGVWVGVRESGSCIVPWNTNAWMHTRGRLDVLRWWMMNDGWECMHICFYAFTCLCCIPIQGTNSHVLFLLHSSSSTPPQRHIHQLNISTIPLLPHHPSDSHHLEIWFTHKYIYIWKCWCIRISFLVDT